jgi:outer membrane lipoprotein-sorting protein
MRKPKFILPMLLFGVLVLMGSACSKETAEEERAPTSGKEVSLEEVLGKAKGLGGYKFDMVLKQTGEADMTSHMWIEGADMRWEGSAEGRDMVYILRSAEQVAYMYLPSQNMAMKYNFTKAKGAVGKSPGEQSEEIGTEYPDAEVLGTEVWDGKTCLVAKGVSDEGDVTTWWLWIEYGIPVKVEFSPRTGEALVTELRNVEVGDIPDSMFELPAGVQPMEIPALGF